MTATINQRALSTVLLLWQPQRKSVGPKTKKGSKAPLLVITCVNKLLQFLLALVDHCCGEAGVWLPGLPVGSYHHQLLPHHCGHLGPLWCHPVHITLRYTGKGILSKVQSDWSMLISQWNDHILYVHNIYHVYFLLMVSRSILFEQNMLLDWYFICFIDKLNNH